MNVNNHTIARFISLVLVAVLLIGVLPLSAQTKNKVVKGNVVSTTGEPIVGASVLVTGTTIGLVTDIKGNFSISVPDKSKSLTISYLGYQTVEVSLDNRTSINIILKEDATQLEGVVVIGYGTVKKKDLTGSIQSVGGKDLVKAMNTDVTEALNGRVGGVLVTKSSNRPGSNMSMEIRGKKSISFSNEPLYVVDGVISFSGIRHINSNDIESIDILKDASSCAIYGSRGSNGVVIVTTKGASKREGFSVEYNGSVGLKTPTNIPDMIGNMGNGMEYVDYRIALWTKKYGPASLGRSDFLTGDERERIRNGEYYDWLRELSSNAVTTNHSVIGSGGSEKTSYTLGLGYTLDNGMIGNEKYERINANIGLEHRITKKVTLGLRSYIASGTVDHGSNDALLSAYFIPPTVSPYDKDGSYLFNCQPTSSKINPFIQIQNNIRQTEEFSASAIGFIEYKPIKDLSIRSQLAYRFDTNLYGEWVGTFTQQKNGINPPSASRNEGRTTNMVWNNIATYNKTFNKDNRLDVIGVFEMQKEQSKSSSMSGDGLPYESLWHAIQTADELTGYNSGFGEYSMMSFMLRANYTFKERYMLTVTGRYDGTSRLAPKNRWGLLPSVGLGWNIKQESFLRDVNFLDNLKLRLSYGKSGNSNIGNYITWTNTDLMRYPFGGKGENGFGLSGTRGNPDLKWEMTNEYNVGLDFGFLNNRLSGSVDVYNRETDDLIMARAVGSINGYSHRYENVGSVGNKGVEVGINSVNISKRDFTWRTNLTVSLNRNKVLSLADGLMEDIPNNLFVGYPLGAMRSYRQLGIWQEEERDLAKKYSAQPGHIKLQDVDGNFSIDEGDKMILGSNNPDWTAGMTNTFTYKNFDLSVYMYMRYGGLYSDDFQYMFTGWDNEHWNKLDVEYWTPENRANKYPAVGAQSLGTEVLGRVKGTFLKIQNITLGYTLPENILKKVRLQDARIYVAVQNPFTFSSYVGSDPEIIGENVYNQMSLYPMTFTFGLNFKF